MNHRIAIVMTLVLCRLSLAQSELVWQGEWEKTDLAGAYHSYVRLDGGTMAAFTNYGTNPGETAFSMFLGVSFQKSPGDWMRWTGWIPLVARDQISDLPDPSEPSKPAHNRMMTRPSVVRADDGSYLCIALICRGYFPQDGLRYYVTMSGPPGSIEKLRNDSAAQHGWRYVGRLAGPVGTYQDEVQKPFTCNGDCGTLMFNPAGPAEPDPSRPAENRYVVIVNQIGHADPTNNGGMTTMLFSADGRSWDFARDDKGEVLNLTPFHTPDDHRSFVSAARTGKTWWMWQSDGWHAKHEGELPGAVRQIFLYRSADGLTWEQLRVDVDCRQFRHPTKNRFLSLKNLNCWWDESTQTLHGMLSVENTEGEGWIKYHNTAKVR
jgi:hypothetical protein